MSVVKAGDTGGSTNIGFIDEGYILFTPIIAGAGIKYLLGMSWKYILIPVIIILIIMLVFYRHPPFRTGYPDNIVIAPAYGIIKEIKTHEDNIVIVILLSLYDPHVQYVPVNSTVESIDKELNWKFKPVIFPSAAGNMKVISTFNTESDDIIVKQIAGFFPRRISNSLKPGDTVRAGEKMGMIKFGSRVDVVIPKDSEIYVSVGDFVRGSFTKLANLKFE